MREASNEDTDETVAMDYNNILCDFGAQSVRSKHVLSSLSIRRAVIAKYLATALSERGGSDGCVRRA